MRCLQIKKLIIDSVDQRGNKALIIASYNDNIVSVNILLENVVNTNIQDKMGNTALMGSLFQKIE